MSEQVKQENKRLLEIINAKPLETVDMDCAFEIEKLKEQLQAKEQECEKLKAKLNPKLRNAHCVYFEGQTGLCKAKEFTRCNPVNCKLYTIDELSTIVDLQNRNTKLEQECEELRKQYNCNACGTCNGKEDYKNMQKHCEKAIAQNHKYKQELKPFKDPYFKGLNNQIIAGLAKKSIRLTTENRKLEQALDEISKILDSGTADTQTNNAKRLHQYYLARYCEIINIINKANTAPTTIFDKIQSFSSDDFSKFIHSLIKCSENLTCDDCYIASLPFQRRICDTKETLEEIKTWLNEEFKEQ